MRLPEEIEAVLQLHREGWGTRRITVALGMSRNTVRRYLRQSGWCAYKQPERPRKLAGLETWLAERFRRHRGNAEVVRQAGRRTGRVGVVAHGRTCRGAVAPAAAGRGTCHGPLRDGAGPPVADRLRSAPGIEHKDQRRIDMGLKIAKFPTIQGESYRLCEKRRAGLLRPLAAPGDKTGETLNPQPYPSETGGNSWCRLTRKFAGADQMSLFE